MVLCSRPSGKVKLSSFTSQSCKTAKKCTKIVLHVQSCCFANLNLLLLWRSRCHPRRCLGPLSPHVSGYFWIRNFFFAYSASVHTYLVYPTYESTSFWIRSPEWKFFNTPRILKTVPSRMLSLLYFLDFSFKSYNVYAVKPSYDYCTPQLC